MADLVFEKLVDDIVDATIENLGVRLNNHYGFAYKETLSIALKYSIDKCLQNYILLNRSKLFDALKVTQHPSVIDNSSDSDDSLVGVENRIFQTGLIVEKSVAFFDGYPEEEITAIAERNIKDDFIFQLQMLSNCDKTCRKKFDKFCEKTAMRYLENAYLENDEVRKILKEEKL